jgi:hypothetical protein
VSYRGDLCGQPGRWRVWLVITSIEQRYRGDFSQGGGEGVGVVTSKEQISVGVSAFNGLEHWNGVLEWSTGIKY